MHSADFRIRQTSFIIVWQYQYNALKEDVQLHVLINAFKLVSVDVAAHSWPNSIRHFVRFSDRELFKIIYLAKSFCGCVISGSLPAIDTYPQ